MTGAGEGSQGYGDTAVATWHINAKNEKAELASALSQSYQAWDTRNIQHD